MIIPEHWAEGRVQQRVGKKTVTVRRFGWSDISRADAQAKADVRAADALRRIVSGESLGRRENKVSYNGADGLPIREEIVGRHGDVVITRNCYGARCLNTPDVLFADVDLKAPSVVLLKFIVIAAVNAVAFLLCVWLQSKVIVYVGLALSLWAAKAVSASMVKRWQRDGGKVEIAARRRIDGFVRSHQNWRLRVYRTPAGFRVVALHKTFAPDEPEVAEVFKMLESDPVYVRMCKNQQCFRARLTAKPWRVGIGTHIIPRPGVWPINPARLADRIRWVESYEEVGKGFAACRFVDEVGGGVADPKVRTVVEVHDELSRANSGLPIA